jgi:hypothetical protein
MELLFFSSLFKLKNKKWKQISELNFTCSVVAYSRIHVYAYIYQCRCIYMYEWMYVYMRSIFTSIFSFFAIFRWWKKTYVCISVIIQAYMYMSMYVWYLDSYVVFSSLQSFFNEAN